MKNKKMRSLTHSIGRHFYAAATRPFKKLIHLFATIIALLTNLPVMNAVWRERRELESVASRLDKDIGLTPGSVRQELKRSYFDIPQDRMRKPYSPSGTSY